MLQTMQHTVNRCIIVISDWVTFSLIKAKHYSITKCTTSLNILNIENKYVNFKFDV